jgi:hypothetical protein
MKTEKITCTCSWCRGEWGISRERLDSMDSGVISHAFDIAFNLRNGAGVDITGKTTIIVVTSSDVCPSCALKLTDGGVKELQSIGIEEITG